MNAPRITAHPDWLENLQKLAGRNSQNLENHQTVRFERNGDDWRAWLCHPMTYPEFRRSLLWELAASFPRRMSGPICAGADAAPCFPHCKPEVREDNEIHNDYDFFRPVIRAQTSGWRMGSPGDAG